MIPTVQRPYEPSGTAAEECRRPERPATRVLAACRILLLVQAAWLVTFSVIEWRRGTLSLDFAFYVQATTEIAHGHLNPYSTVLRVQVWRNHGEGLLWVLAPLVRLPGGGLWLLAAQDLATVAGEWVALTWVFEIVCGSRWPLGLPRRPVLALAALMLLLNPWVYEASAFDFHLQAFAVLGALLATRALVAGQPRLAMGGVALTLLCGDVAGTYVFAVGACVALLSRRARKTGLAVMAVGVTWTTLLAVIGANDGSNLLVSYGYLAGSAEPPAGPMGIIGGLHAPGHLTLADVAAGALLHPGRILGQLGVSGRALIDTVLPVGVAGMASPFGLVPLITLLADGLHAGTSSARPGTFQSLPVWAFSVVGLVWLLERLKAGTRSLRLVATGAFLACALSAWAWLPSYRSGWPLAPPSTSAQLARVSTGLPGSAEVVVSQGVMADFATRPSLVGFTGLPADVMVRRPMVYFVFAPQAGIEAPVGDTAEAELQVGDLPGAMQLSSAAGVTVFRWLPPPGTRDLHLSRRGAIVEGPFVAGGSSVRATIGR